MVTLTASAVQLEVIVMNIITLSLCYTSVACFKQCAQRA